MIKRRCVRQQIAIQSFMHAAAPTITATYYCSCKLQEGESAQVQKELTDSMVNVVALPLLMDH
jgi:hypothetical protein